MRLEDDHFLSKCLYNSDLPWLAVWTHQYCSHSTATVLFFNQALVIGPSIQAVKTIWGLNSFGLISSSTGKQSETISKVWKETKLARAWATSLVSIYRDAQNGVPVAKIHVGKICLGHRGTSSIVTSVAMALFLVPLKVKSIWRFTIRQSNMAMEQLRRHESVSYWKGWFPMFLLSSG